MTHKERSAWLFLTIFVITYVPYFAISAQRGLPATLPGFEQLTLFGITAVIQMVLIGLGHLYFYLRHREDMRAPTDERDRAIELRGLRYSYYVLITGAIIAGVYLPFVEASGWKLVQSMIFFIVLAEVVGYAVVLFEYRRAS